MSTPFLGEIRAFSFNFVPKGWALCNGQLLPINQNQALFSLLGTTYGGDGIRTFALPNLQGRVTMHMGTQAGRSYPIGQSSGELTHTLTQAEMPSHTHAANAAATPGTLASPAGSFWAEDSGGNTTYSASSGAVMSSKAIAQAGSSQPHENEMPYLVATFAIALSGIFPSRS